MAPQSSIMGKFEDVGRELTAAAPESAGSQVHELDVHLEPLDGLLHFIGNESTLAEGITPKLT